MTDDLPATIDAAEPPAGAQIPAGSTVIHGRADAGEIWRLCCRLRLSMRDDGLGIKDAHKALTMAYPDLPIGQQDLKRFMEVFVDESIVLGPGFFKKGVMRTKAKLNAVAEAAKLADLSQKAVENIKGGVSLQDLPKYTLAVERAQKARERQYNLMERVGMGAETDRERAAPTATKASAPPVHIENATFNLSEAIGGSFGSRRANSVDADGKAKA